jgi:hypothetical protein
MNQLTILSNDADQLCFVPLSDGSIVQLEFVYRPGIQRWTVSINHPQLLLNGYMLCVSPNLLRQWRNLIPFGLAVTSIDGYDPVDVNDLTNGRISVYVLTPAEVQQVESQILQAPALVNA